MKGQWVSVLALVIQLLEEVTYIFCFYKIIKYSAIQNSEGWLVPPARNSESEVFLKLQYSLTNTGVNKV